MSVHLMIKSCWQYIFYLYLREKRIRKHFALLYKITRQLIFYDNIYIDQTICLILPLVRIYNDTTIVIFLDRILPNETFVQFSTSTFILKNISSSKSQKRSRDSMTPWLRDYRIFNFFVAYSFMQWFWLKILWLLTLWRRKF